MPIIRVSICSVFALTLAAVPARAEAPPHGLTLTPDHFVLRGRTARQRLVVTRTENGRAVDCTAKAAFRSDAPAIAHVGGDGIVTPVGDGTATITARLDGREARATVRVIDGARLPPVTFERDVIPILTRAGCNAGACHGKARGQNGFALSLLSYDADFDYHAIVNEARGRRVFAAAPEYSLLLRKASAQLPHGGGKRLEVGSAGYDVLRRWIAAGLPRTPKTSPDPRAHHASSRPSASSPPTASSNSSSRPTSATAPPRM